MDDELAAAIATTQQDLGGLFQKPKLSEKLLSKAPFRFLHDIMSAITAATGFAAGLYSEEELDSGNIKDKASKLAYLDKIVLLVGICSGSAIDVRPVKVVAGLEPEGTNALLAALGRCAKSTSLDFEEAVRRALNGESPGANPPPIRNEAGGDGGGGGGGGGGRDGAIKTGRRDSVAAESKSEAKGSDNPRIGTVDRGADGVDAVRRGSGDGASRRGSTGGGGGGGGYDEKASAKQEIEEMGAAAKTMGVPHSRRLSSRAGGQRAEPKRDNPATGGLGEDPSGMGGRDLTSQVEACTGEIAVTREMLEPIITRPRLADKLLNMPPFRFLHDIVSEVTKQTGFGTGLYSEQELDSANVKAKPDKIAYLDKLITLVGTSLNTLVDARPAKIVAGLEAENTNRMLQLLALAAKERPDSTREVAIVLGANAAPVKRRSSAQGSGSAGRGDPDRPIEGQREQQQQQQPAERNEQQATSLRRSSVSSGSGQDGASDNARTESARGGSRSSSVGEAKADAGISQQPPAEEKTRSASTADGRAREAAAESQADTAGGGDAKRSMRPRTARRRPPAVRDNAKDFVDSGRVVVPDIDPKASSKVGNIMMDGDDDKESDEEDQAEAGFTARAPSSGGGALGVGGAGAKGEGGSHTAMVADILKEKERAEISRAKEAEAEAKGGSDSKEGDANSGGGIRMGRLRGPRSSNSKGGYGGGKGATSATGGGSNAGYGDGDVAKLKETIQTLCQSTNPLGKCMDFVHEDLSLMSQEMDRWKALYKVKADALEIERAATEEFLRPLRLQLSDLEEQLKESSMKINGVKAGIAANDKKIGTLLKMVVSS